MHIKTDKKCIVIVSYQFLNTFISFTCKTFFIISDDTLLVRAKSQIDKLPLVSLMRMIYNNNHDL